MPDTSSITSECGVRIVNGIDFLARRFNLRKTPVDLSTPIGELGLGDNDCGILERYINKQLDIAGKPKLSSGKIKSTTTVQEAIDHAC